MRPTLAVIHTSNLKYNFLAIRKKVKKTRVMAVVKADAYGHGMIKCVEALKSLGDKSPEYYGVALLEEAIELRKSKITDEPILSFAPFLLSEINNYKKYKIIPTVCTAKHINDLYKLNKRIKIHINIETGMGRLGINFMEAAELISRLTKNKNIIIDGIYTHFATSDVKNKKFAQLQLQRFNKVLSELKSKNIDYGLAHTANSGAILDMPETWLDMVRVGISLYGYYPSQETSESIKLTPVMSLISKVSTVHYINKGDSVSYGRKFIAKQKTKIATVPIGYADGFNWGLTNNASAIIKGKTYPQVGRVSMDRIMFDVGDDKIKVGDKVILLGSSKEKSITAWNWSSVLNTIPYEITCGISKRVPRVFK
jgi:alanine racemase